MNRVVLLAMLTLLSSLVRSADWQTGTWESVTDRDTVTVSINEIQTESLILNLRIQSIANPEEIINITASEFQFADESKKTIQLNSLGSKLSETYYQLGLTTFGEITITLIDEQASKKNKVSFMKPALPEITDLKDYSLEQALIDLPDANTWLKHVSSDLWKYWGTDEAASYASYRCNDGQLIDLENLCRELRQGWVRAGIQYDYTRMVSRQTYLYGAIFNMTGNTEALEFMNIGIDILLGRFENNGSVGTLLLDGNAQLRPEQRTSQDLAYVQIGLAMAYYLTGDNALLDKIDSLKNYIIANYYQEDLGMLAWTLEDNMPGDSTNKELVSQLDQLNAYMLLVYPHLPDNMKPKWEEDIRLMVDILLTKFHIEGDQRFAGQIIKEKFNKPGDRHNDFGHSVKTYWMIYTAGKLLNDESYLSIGRTGIDTIVKQAIRFRTGPRGMSTWANQSFTNGSSWWEFAELSQATATLALEDKNYVRFLPDVYDTWLNNYVDQIHGGVFMSTGGSPKQHLWKNGYHEAEMALIAFIASQFVNDQTVDLYFTRNKGHLQPYLFEREVTSIQETTDHVFKVTFQ